MSLIPTILQPYLTYLKLGVAAAALTGAGYAGWKVESLRWDASLVAQAKAADKAKAVALTHERTATAITQTSRDEGDTQQAKTRTVYQTITKEVPYYVPSVLPPTPVGQPWSVPLGALRLHDYAATGTTPPIPAPTSEPVGAPTGIELPALIGTVSDNYGVCRGYRIEAETWRDWYAHEFAAWGAVK
ncbi:hypothetical protein [Novosphingobium sp.]|uniref:hypothetical protein n=1 Tax=Novosphingobium sp. TaxID=1874826 RepID=UPI003B51A86B